MYSVVMAAMLTAGAGSTTGWCHGCLGCHGWHGCHGCHGYYSGCCGGCSGCYGGCWGCYGCHGCWGGYSCYGCSGSYCHGCYGCYGGVVYQPAIVYSSCYGCCGGVAYSAPYASVSVPAVTYASTATSSAPIASSGSLTPRTSAERDAIQRTLEALRRGASQADQAQVSQTPAKTSQPQAARITVKLPSSAKLWVDNVHCPLTSSVRSFDTPALTPGQQYFYTMRMEAEKDGQTVTQSRRVLLTAGQQINVDFNSPGTVTAQR